jgi:hypothetical protein
LISAHEGGTCLAIKVAEDGSFRWQNEYRFEETSCWTASIAPSPDGAFVIGGTSSRFDPDPGSPVEDLYVFKIDEDGGLIWEKLIDLTARDYSLAATCTSDGDAVVTGWTAPLRETPDLFLVRISENGSVVWARTCGDINSSSGQAVIECHDGGFALAGTKRTENGNNDVYVLRTNASGEVAR